MHARSSIWAICTHRRQKTKAFSQIEKMFPGKKLKGLLNDPQKIVELVRVKKDFDDVLSALAE